MKKFTLLTICVMAISLLWAQEVPGNWTITSAALTATEETTPANVSDGSSSASMTWTSTDTQKLRSDDFAVTEGSAVSISLDILDNTNAGRTRYGIGWGADAIDWTLGSSEYSVDQAGFQTITYTGTVPAGYTTAYIEIRFYDETAGWATNGNTATNIVDNMIVTLDGGSNIVLNGSFETWGAVVLMPNLYITAPSNNSTVNTTDVNVTFVVENFVLGTDGKVKYSVDGGADVFQLDNTPIALTGLTEAVHTVNMELVDMSDASLSPAETYNISFTVDLSAPSYTTIYEIQYTTDISGNSPLNGLSGTTKGVVSAVFGDKFWIQDGAGAWNGLYVYYITTPGPARGDSVMVTGTITEYNNLTEVSPVTNVTVLNSGNVVAAATILATGSIGAELYEGVLVKTTGVCTNADAGYGMWTISDGSGDILVDDVLFAYTPVVGNSYTVTGIVDYSFTEWKMFPRDAADVIDNGASSDPLLSVTSPENNATIYADNTSVVFTVSNFVLGTDGKVAWNLDGAANAYVTVSPIVITGLTAGAHTINLALVDMSNNPLSTPVNVTINITVNLSGPTYTDIYDIQYSVGGDSPLIGQEVWVRAVVSANFNGSEFGEGYFIQQGGGAWNGIYVYDLLNAPAIGDSVEIAGTIDEFYTFTQIETVTSFTVIAPDGIVAPATLVSTLDGNSEQYESCLIKVHEAECMSSDPYGEWTINDGTGALKCQDNGIWEFTEVVGTRYDITGVTSFSYGLFELNYRRESDIVVLANIDSEFASQISLYPNPASDYITVNVPHGAEMITITNLVGQVVSEINVDSEISTIDIENLEAGVYFVKITKAEKTAIVKIVVE